MDGRENYSQFNFYWHNICYERNKGTFKNYERYYETQKQI